MSNLATSSALGQIRSLTDTSAPLFAYYQHDNIEEIKKILCNLNQADSREVIGKLSDAELKQIARMMNDDSLFVTVGLSQDQRNQFFSEMARDLDGATLAKLFKAFDEKPRTAAYSRLALDNITALSQAINTQSAPKSKLDFIAALAPQSTDQAVMLLEGDVRRRCDPQAQVIAQVISGLRGPAAEQALELLKPAQLQAVLAAAVQREDPPASYSPEGMALALPPPVFNVQALEGVLKAAASISDPDTKALVFNQAVNQLQELQGEGRSDDVARVRQALGKLLLSDATGVVGKLASLFETRDGKALASFCEACLQAKDFGTLAELQARLCLGNEKNEDPTKRFNTLGQGPRGAPVYQNAETAGYFAGAIQAGLKRLSSDAARTNDLATALFKVALSALDKSVKTAPIYGFLIAAAKDGVPPFTRPLIEATGKRDEAEKIALSFLPFVQTGTRPNGTPVLETSATNDARSAFGERRDAVILSAR
jgi:hypothetical protein